MKVKDNQPFWQKSTFKTIFIMTAIILVLLPFSTTFNEFLTKTVEKFQWYSSIQDYVVPWEIKMVGALLIPFGVKFIASSEGMTINGVYLKMTWNCIGWQSLVLIAITFIIGLQGSYNKISKLECILIGLLGTFLINLFRLAFTAVLGAYFGSLFAIIFHDYFTTFVTLTWLIFFWWFSYAFVLQPKLAGGKKLKIKNKK